MSEFMLDLVWWQEESIEGKKRQRCALAVESEWRDVLHVPRAEKYAEDVASDFEKLLSIKSPLKLMVFSSHQQIGLPPKAKDVSSLILGQLFLGLQEFEQLEEEETYLFIDFGNHKNKEPDRAYSIKIGAGGALPDSFPKPFRETMPEQ
jgi:hypothetical protein